MSLGYKSLLELEGMKGVSILGPKGKDVPIIGVHRVGEKDTRKILFSNGLRMEATVDHNDPTAA